MNPVYLVMINTSIISSLTMFIHMRNNSVLSLKSKRYFTLLFFGIVIVAASEALGDCMNIDGSYRTAHMIVKCVEFCVMPCLTVLMALACNVVVHPKWAVIPLSIHAIFEWLALPFKLVIDIDASGFYHHGSCYFIYLIVDAASLVYLLIAFLKLSGKYGAKKMATLWMTAAVLFSALIPSIVNSKCRTSLLGITLCAIILYEYYQSLIQRELSDNLKKQKRARSFCFEQTATALVNAIDAKDKYTHGHSSRVAEYSRKIAELSGKSAEECSEIFFPHFCMMWER